MSQRPLRSLKRFATGLLARTVRRPRLGPGELPDLQPDRILIVRQHNQMGDMVCATPALRAIRETFPGAEVALVTAPINVEVVRHLPLLDRVITFDRRYWRRPRRLMGFLSSLRRWRPDLAFVLSSVSFSVTSAAIALASGARHVVGADSRPFGWEVSRHCFSLEMPASPTLDRHAVAHSLAPLQAVGVTTEDLSTLVVAAPEERARATDILAELELEPGFWAVHPGAGKPQNVWPADYLAATVQRAVAAGRSILVLSGPADGVVVERLFAALDPPARSRTHLAPPIAVGVAAALLQRADRFLCNDTGIMHVAGALRVPTLALFGPTDPALWKPPAPEVVALRSPAQSQHPAGGEFGWMENLETEEVWRTWCDLPAATHDESEA